MTREELTEAIKKSEQRLADLAVQFEEALDWAEYLKEEQARADFEFVLSPNGNKVRRK